MGRKDKTEWIKCLSEVCSDQMRIEATVKPGAVLLAFKLSPETIRRFEQSEEFVFLVEREQLRRMLREIHVEEKREEQPLEQAPTGGKRR